MNIQNKMSQELIKRGIPVEDADLPQWQNALAIVWYETMLERLNGKGKLADQIRAHLPRLDQAIRHGWAVVPKL